MLSLADEGRRLSSLETPQKQSFYALTPALSRSVVNPNDSDEMLITTTLPHATSTTQNLSTSSSTPPTAVSRGKLPNPNWVPARKARNAGGDINSKENIRPDANKKRFSATSAETDQAATPDERMSSNNVAVFREDPYVHILLAYTHI